MTRGVPGTGTCVDDMAHLNGGREGFRMTPAMMCPRSEYQYCGIGKEEWRSFRDSREMVTCCLEPSMLQLARRSVMVHDIGRREKKRFRSHEFVPRSVRWAAGEDEGRGLWVVAWSLKAGWAAQVWRKTEARLRDGVAMHVTHDRISGHLT